MEAYEDHWRGAPAYDNLIFRVVPNQADMLAALQTGEINMTNSIPYDLAVSVQDDPNISIASQKSIRVQYVNIDTAVEPLNDKRVRQALNYAVDKQAIIEGHSGRPRHADPHAHPAGELRLCRYPGALRL